MIDVATMNETRRRVLRGIRELSRKQERVTYEQLGTYADCSAKTAQRAVAELVQQKKVLCYSGRRSGNRYELVR